ncbi:winged helix-turn-helix domain-containing protein [Rheinheimera marina]|uniref:Winged helix-turn-helix domain-containing protein n=1 Tax=Rheinheimera marina TaxID=1774958 RepID=A0ABV9JLN2_9GAMM
MNRPLAQLKVGDWWYLPHLDKLVKLDEQAKVQQKLELDNLCQSVLNYFLLHPGRLISKEELLKEVWHLSSVTDGRIARVISILRDVLSDDVKAPTYIETINKRGYRFIAAVEVVEIAAPAAAEPEPVNKPKPWFWVAALLLVLLAGVAGWLYWQQPEEEPENKVLFGHWAPVSSMDGFEYYPSLSKDGRYLVYSFAKAGQLKNTLMLQDLTTQQKYILVDNGRDNYGASFSPDGQRIAYQSLIFRQDCEIRLLTLNNSNPREILHDEKLTDCGKNSVSARISWAPDGNSLLYSSSVSEEARMALSSYDFQTKNVRQLLLPSPLGFGDFVARYSHQGDKIAFLRDIAGEAVQLWLMDLRNQETAKVLQLENAYPGDLVWSKDDKIIFFPSFANSIEKVNLSTPVQETAVVTDNRVYELLLTPDNNFIGSIGRFGAYHVKKYNNKVLNPDNTNEFVFKSSRDETSVDINPDAAKPIALVSKRTGLAQIWLLSEDGEQKMISNFDKQVTISELKFSHSGRYLLALVDQNLWLFTENGGRRVLADSNAPTKNISAAPFSDSFFYATNKLGRWQVMKYDPSEDSADIVSAGDDLYEYSQNGSYLLTRDAETRKYSLFHLTKKVDLPAQILDRMVFDPQIKVTERGIYFSGVDDKNSNNVLFFSFEDQKIEATGEGSELYTSRFSLSPDERFIYLVVGDTRDIDIAQLNITQ